MPSAGVHVLVLPLPLIAGHADGELGVAHVLHLQDELGGRDRHHHQDDHGNDGPDDFHLRAVQHGGVRDRTLRCPELDQRVDHRAEHHDRDADADPERLHVQVVDVAAHVGDAHRQVVAVRGVGAAPWRMRRRQRASGGGLQQAAVEEAAAPVRARCRCRLCWVHSSRRILQVSRSMFKRRRFVHPAHQAAQTPCKPASFLFGEEAADLARSAPALDGQAARIQARSRTAQSNLRPMPRKLLFCLAAPGARHETDPRVGDEQRSACRNGGACWHARRARAPPSRAPRTAARARIHGSRRSSQKPVKTSTYRQRTAGRSRA